MGLLPLLLLYGGSSLVPTLPHLLVCPFWGEEVDVFGGASSFASMENCLVLWSLVSRVCYPGATKAPRLEGGGMHQRGFVTKITMTALVRAALVRAET